MSRPPLTLAYPARVLPLSLAVAWALCHPSRAMAAHAVSVPPTQNELPAVPQTAPRPSSDPSDAQTEGQVALDEARALLTEGLSLRDAGDDEGAIAAWTTAYGVAPLDAQRLRFFLAAHLAAAHGRVYEADGDIKHLRMEQQLLRRYVELYPVEGEDLELRERNLRLARDRIVAIEALLKLSTSPTEASVAAPPIMSQQNLVLLEKQRLAERLFVTSAILIPTGTLLALTCGTIFALSGSGPAEVFMAASPGIVAAGTGLVTLSIGIRQSNLARRGVVQIAPSWTPTSAGASLRLRFLTSR